MGNFPIYDSSMSRSFAKPSPASAAGATSSISVGAAARMFRELLRPILRLAIKSGLRYAELDDILRSVLFDEARNECSTSKRINASALALMTGLHRKEISSRLIRDEGGNLAVEKSLRDRPMASQVFEHWARKAQRNPSYQTLLSADSSDRAESFVKMAKRVVTDVHPRAILDELIRLGLVSEKDGEASLLTDTFTPPGAADDRIPLMIDNASAHLRTCAQNSMGAHPPQLEQAIWGRGVSLKDAVEIETLARKNWKRAHKELFDAIARAPEAPESQERYEVRIGMYFNHAPIAPSS
jgi:Family of unknown function (DUF6502)